jgi:hypothetical protein
MEMTMKQDNVLRNRFRLAKGTFGKAVASWPSLVRRLIARAASVTDVKMTLVRELGD